MPGSEEDWRNLLKMKEQLLLCWSTLKKETRCPALCKIEIKYVNINGGSKGKIALIGKANPVEIG